MSEFEAGKEQVLTIRKSIAPKPKVKELGEKAYVEQARDRVQSVYRVLVLLL